jgi:hypothetical protein
MGIWLINRLISMLLGSQEQARQPEMPDSSVEPTMRVIDYSVNNPYYDMANRLARALDEDPNGQETLERFVSRKTKHITLSDKQVEQAQKKAAWPGNLSPDLEFEFLKIRVDTLLAQIQDSKIAARKMRRDELAVEKASVLTQLESGLDPKYDPNILQIEDVEALRKSFIRKETSRAIEELSVALANGQEPTFDARHLPQEIIDSIHEEFFEQKREAELRKVGEQLHLGQEVSFDEELVSPDDVAQIQASMGEARNLWLRTRVRPAAQNYGVSHYGAEHLVRDWLVFLGFEDAEVTRQSQDGGIDVESSEFVCQVKHYKSQPVTVQEVREIFGVSSSLGKSALIFTTSNLTASASLFAEQVGMATVHFDPYNAMLTALNEAGRKLLHEGCYE